MNTSWIRLPNLISKILLIIIAIGFTIYLFTGFLDFIRKQPFLGKLMLIVGIFVFYAGIVAIYREFTKH